MSKELTPLEAFNEIIYGYGYDKNVEIVSKALQENIVLNLANIALEQHLKLAEKELERKQDLEKMLHKMNVKHGYEEYLKISKALEIIKTKRVNVVWLIWCIELYDTNELVLCRYNDCVPNEINREEYDLLKEVLR